VKKLSLLLVPFALLAAPFATATDAKEEAAAKRSLCHRTSSAARPYVKIRVTAAQMRAHQRHAADIIPAPAGACPRTRLTANGGGRALASVLVGETESPAGDPVATGTATIRLRAGQGQVCFRIEVENLSEPAAAAHIHRGAAGVVGGIVVGLRAPGANGESSGCVTAARALVPQILRSPSGFYVNVHTASFPGGAVRGQLGGTQADAGTSFSRPLTGAEECNAAGTCNLGDPDGSGTAVVRLRPDDGQVCFRLTVSNIRLPAVGAHIHRAARGVSGPIVVPFTSPGTGGSSSGCTAAARELIDQIQAQPAQFYVNVHTTDYPAGAVRAQLG
jgi:CHRD domain